VQLPVGDAAVIRNQDRSISMVLDRFVKQQCKVNGFYSPPERFVVNLAEKNNFFKELSIEEKCLFYSIFFLASVWILPYTPDPIRMKIEVHP
jgi:hypothetical protein